MGSVIGGLRIEMGLFQKPTFDLLGPPVSLFSVSLVSALYFILSFLWVFSFILILKFLN